MKFKVATIGLLTAILATCIFTSYKLITEAQKQTEYNQLQTQIMIDTVDYGIGRPEDPARRSTEISGYIKWFSEIK